MWEILGVGGAQSWGLNETTCKSSWHHCDQKEGRSGGIRKRSTEIFNSHTIGLFNSKVFKIPKDNNF